MTSSSDKPSPITGRQGAASSRGTQTQQKPSNASATATPRRGSARTPRSPAVAAPPVAGAGPPCGACKFLRRKCLPGCIFAPYFASDQGAARFAAVHKVFGASNVSKLLLHLPVGRRHDAVVTVCYEAQARLSDPVYGCVSTILALQQQVNSLQAELSIVQAQLLSNRLTVGNALQYNSCSNYQQTIPSINVTTAGVDSSMAMQPNHSNASSGSNDLVLNHLFNSGSGGSNSSEMQPRLQFVEGAIMPPRQEDLNRLSHSLTVDDPDGEETEEETKDPIVSFVDGFLYQK